jgi:hypothetical protein
MISLSQGKIVTILRNIIGFTRVSPFLETLFLRQRVDSIYSFLKSSCYYAAIISPRKISSLVRSLLDATKAAMIAALLEPLLEMHLMQRLAVDDGTIFSDYFTRNILIINGPYYRHLKQLIENGAIKSNVSLNGPSNTL